MIQRVAFLLATTLVAVAAFGADGTPLQLTLDNTTVRVANVTLGGAVVLFTASLTTRESLLLQRTGAQTFLDSDRDGVVVYQRASRIPLRSVWIAIDIDSGRYSVATPPDFQLPPTTFPAHLLKHEADGIIGLFENEQLTAEMLVVRPKEGAWRLRATEGGSGDADRTHNGKLSLAAGDATPVRGTSSPAPKRLKSGDVIAMIDPRRLDTVITEIGKE